MIDAHCHLDAYPDPYRTALTVEWSRVLTIAVTNLPSAFEAAYPHVRGLRYIRLAVGLHPLFAEHHPAELRRFVAALGHTSYVGEVGLDFSREGLPTRDQQLATFRFVLEQVRRQPKYVTVHSRRAESAVLDQLEEVGVGPVVFHWYSGPLTQLDRLLALGHFCSVNPAMLRSERGRAIIARLPPDRVLTETDGPYVSVAGRSIAPGDVAEVEAFLARQWGQADTEVHRQLQRNLRAAIPVEPARSARSEGRAT